MAEQNINVSTPDSGNGDPLRDSFIKTNTTFPGVEVFANNINLEFDKNKVYQSFIVTEDININLESSGVNFEGYCMSFTFNNPSNFAYNFGSEFIVSGSPIVGGIHRLIMMFNQGEVWVNFFGVNTSTTQLDSPANLSANVNVDEVTLSWDAVTDATDYEVYRDGILIETTSSTSSIDTSVPDGTYIYDVIATASGFTPSNPSSILVTVGELSLLTFQNLNGWASDADGAIRVTDRSLSGNSAQTVEKTPTSGDYEILAEINYTDPGAKTFFISVKENNFSGQPSIYNTASPENIRVLTSSEQVTFNETAFTDGSAKFIGLKVVNLSCSITLYNDQMVLLEESNTVSVTSNNTYDQYIYFGTNLNDPVSGDDIDFINCRIRTI